ncbi:single-stranded DNA-binding protein [Sporosalibacterium faouarense]|uniref:single-stranded DNA-binding protein n=1 Tax=Sporosalibacterium faouarense TaxID=516123 RepID=UPI00141D6240|nr:single-stranded DNA-binding protein [Sporosalibacterium faouarense]MTI46218.1 single-stranded DNA-binding protein [Bacillota bacterium]
MNNVTLVGRLTADPELRFLPGNGTAVASFTMAIDKDLPREKKQQMEQQGKPTADFPRIVVWGRPAENCATYLNKGKLVAVQGRIQTRSYDNNQGQRVYVTEVVAEKVQFLEWGDSNNNNNNNNSRGYSNSDRNNNNDHGMGGIDTDGFQPVDDEDIPF